MPMRLFALVVALTVLAVIGGCAEQECMSHCPDDREQICGTDDVTYENSCFATCAGEDVQYGGPCTGADDTVDQQ